MRHELVIEILEAEMIGPGFHGLGLIERVGAAGQHQHLDHREHILDAPAGLIPVYPVPAQAHVDHRQVRAVLFGQGHTFLA